MSKKFMLPDLGEGLPDATIVEWYVKVGDTIKLDDNLVSMETAKAVVDVPSPVSGKVLQLAGAAGDIVVTGTMLAEFEVDASCRSARKARTPATTTARPTRNRSPLQRPSPRRRRMQAPWSARCRSVTPWWHKPRPPPVASRRCRRCARPHASSASTSAASRATGPDGTVTMDDVKRAAADGSAKPGAAPARSGAQAAVAQVAAPAVASRSTLSQSGKPMRTQPPGGDREWPARATEGRAPQHGAGHGRCARAGGTDHAGRRRRPARVEPGNQDITARLVRAIVTACKTVPALNAWFDGANLTRTLHPHVDLGIAVDTDDGLFVPALRNADMLDGNGVRAAIKRLRAQVEERSIPSSELTGYTISLSNFGMFAGRYATPVVVPPCVAIIGAGKLSHDVVAVMGGIEVHRRMPISLTFDHRACTGGEAARFLAALLDDLAQPT
jgi:pyruvate dehydrogenase E2 component (dihydrolipoamide acetyltransferase)